ncbi:hypothetical protein BS17DRAFT_783336 [Gyrodon lividus]|nr:hypothetical protein BS17DRAFT_783336 [Gyrodon lividus]
MASELSAMFCISVWAGTICSGHLVTFGAEDSHRRSWEDIGHSRALLPDHEGRTTR